MKMSHTTLALAVATLCLASPAQASDINVELAAADMDRLGVTMQVIDDSDTAAMSQLTLPTAATAHTDRALPATERQQSHDKANGPGSSTASGHTEDADHGLEHREHGKAVSAIAKTLGETKRGGDEDFAQRHNDLRTQARENSHQVDTATERAREAAEHAYEATESAVEHATEEGQDATSEAVEHAAEGAAESTE